MSKQAKRLRRKPARVAPVVSLDDYRADREDVAAVERMIAADEEVCAKALIADWTSQLWQWRCPTAAFLVTLARAIDDALESDDHDGLRERLEMMRDAAEHEAARRIAK